MIFSARIHSDISDAVRFVLLWKFGGLYSDTDIINMAPIPKEEFVIGRQDPTVLNSNFMKVAYGGHYFFLQAILYFVDRYSVSIYTN